VLALALLLGLTVTPVMANGKSNNETLGPFSAGFDIWQFYPAHPLGIIRLDYYYGQAVWVHYVAVNEWTMTRKQLDADWWLRQSLTQRGTAYVWNEDKTTLLDTQPFTVNEKTHGTVNYLANWYHVTSFASVDFWDYHWHIDGIYHYWGHAKDDYDNRVFKYWIRGYGWFPFP